MLFPMIAYYIATPTFAQYVFDLVSLQEVLKDHFSKSRQKVTVTRVRY